MDQCWYHGTITRSRAEDLLSKVGKDGSFLVRASESIHSAYALCLLYQNCVYTYRILPKENKLVIQASEGVPVQYFNNLSELIDFYKKGNMGLVRSLKFPVQREEEEAPDELEEDMEPVPVPVPPILPPRSVSIPAPMSETKEDVSDEIASITELAQLSLSETLLQRLQHQDTSSIPEEHLKLIQDYLRVHVISDLEMVQLGSGHLPQLKKLMAGLCKGIFSEVSRTLPSLDSIRKVFDQQLPPGIHRHPQPSCEVTRAKQACFLTVQLTGLLASIEDKVKKLLIEGPETTHRRSLIPPVTFEVKADSLGISSKIHLKVDVELGKLIIKKAKDGPEDKFYTHNKIRQLIKSQKFPNKLVIVLETEKEKTQRKEYVFADSKKREGFCQLLQQMKNKHSEQPEPDMITIFVGTWNMGDAPPPKKISSWFLSKGQGKTRDDTADYIPHDIYVIGTQEDSLGEKEWQEILRQSLQEITSISFKVIAIHTLWNIRIVILAKPEHENRISHLCIDNVKTGIANRLGNKGAVGVSFMFNGTSFGFVNSHLTSGSEKKHRRNQNYTSILRFLSLGDKKLSPFNITHRFTHLFWLGDLNYRLELPTTEAENIVQKIKQQQYPELLAFDQLLVERKDQKVFLQFEEEEISFAPTYRFERNTRENYVYTKQKATGMKYNLPSWCDRVLWKSYPLVHVVCQSYGCTSDIMTSDHSPVFATFEVAVTSQFVSKNDNKYTGSLGQIQFLHCSATLKTKSQTKFYIEFYSSCLESFVKSQEGENEEGNEGELVVKFDEALPKLTPIISDPEYLLDQHILISIKSSDSDESYGEGCIALQSGATESQVPIYTVLTHHGEKTGIFQGDFKLQTSQGKQREKLYDFVKIERDEASGQKPVRGLSALDSAKEWEQGNRGSCSTRKSSHLVAKEAAAIARYRGTTSASQDEPSKDELLRTVATDFNNPSYLRLAAASQQFSATSQMKQIPSPDQPPLFWNCDPQPKDSTSLMGLESPTTPSSLSPVSPRPIQSTANRNPGSRNQDQHLYSEVRKSLVEPLLLEDMYPKPEMIDNPLYDFTKTKEKPVLKREPEFLKASRKELPGFPFTKSQEAESSKPSNKPQSSPPFLVPTPRFRSYTCSNQAEEKTALNEKMQSKQKPCANLDPLLPVVKRPVKLSRSEVGQSKPPLPSKSQVVLDMQNSKGRDYRESSELPHHRKHQNEDGTISRTMVP
ncbi:phosphatidylinositol 3,4,5-trisphosphate 5-phosphatase 1 isoform X2 [Hemicordylus capensis]|uniref:phosphatidylinositol 3,4,5-trisphosphate 5-phosphatase 1 isoform X2 n=1 Tax=Hemicordylus capensis TaxID=884348 RepID=UPI0023031BF9|nr:phosphatidylinositol 3,4,5-trisphosphate 5-phosphatase 1 isoform X2 [Hemicordylus capensis]